MGIDPSTRVCPRCGEAAGEEEYCQTCGLHLAVQPELPTAADWRSASQSHGPGAVGPIEASGETGGDRSQPGLTVPDFRSAAICGAIASGLSILILLLPWYHGAGGLIGHPTGWQALRGLDVAFALVGGLGLGLAMYGLAVDAGGAGLSKQSQKGVVGFLVGTVGVVLAAMAFIAIVSPPSPLTSSGRAYFSNPSTNTLGLDPRLSVSVGPFLAVVLAIVVAGAGYSMWRQSNRAALTSPPPHESRVGDVRH